MASKQSSTPKSPREAKVADAARAQALREKVSTSQLNAFMDFVRTQGVVGLAIGLAIGTQASATVKSIVEGIINPFVGFVVGNQNGLLTAGWNVVGQDTAKIDYWFMLGSRTLVIGWGEVLSSLITLLAVAAVIFYIVKGFKLDKLDKKKVE